MSNSKRYQRLFTYKLTAIYYSDHVVLESKHINTTIFYRDVKGVYNKTIKRHEAFTHTENRYTVGFKLIIHTINDKIVLSTPIDEQYRHIEHCTFNRLRLALSRYKVVAKADTAKSASDIDNDKTDCEFKIYADTSKVSKKRVAIWSTILIFAIAILPIILINSDKMGIKHIVTSDAGVVTISMFYIILAGISICFLTGAADMLMKKSHAEVNVSFYNNHIVLQIGDSSTKINYNNIEKCYIFTYKPMIMEMRFNSDCFRIVSKDDTYYEIRLTQYDNKIVDSLNNGQNACYVIFELNERIGITQKPINFNYMRG